MHIVIITNGSYRKPEWWQALGRVLDWRDEIHWSIDGWDQSSNEQYRVNCNWTSIMSGIRAFRSVNRETYRVWATIGFSFNEHHLEDIKDIAYNFKFDAWQLTKSTKFGSHYPDAYGVDDPLCPTDSQLVAQGHRFQREVTDLSERARPGSLLKEIFWSRAQDIEHKKQYPALCSIGNKGVFLNSRGEFFPCCWTANRYSHNQNWIDMAQSRFNLNQRTLTQIQEDRFWHQEFLEFNSLECQTKCTSNRLKDKEHVTEW
jgi:MoaA/NifB/PqqE/SkfB family radical SAM enzyme